MARFDVYRTRGGEQLLLDCQADTLDYFSTRFVVPLVNADTAQKTSRLHPAFIIGDSKMIMATQLASAVDENELGDRIMSLAHEQFAILDALDMLISGY